MLQPYEVVWTLPSSVWFVIKNFLLIDAIDRNKISNDHHWIFFCCKPFPHFIFLENSNSKKKMSNSCSPYIFVWHFTMSQFLKYNFDMNSWYYKLDLKGLCVKIKAVLFATGMTESWITLCIDSVSILINLISSFIFSENSSIFQGQLNEKKLEPITLIVWVQGRVEKMPKM